MSCTSSTKKVKKSKVPGGSLELSKTTIKSIRGILKTENLLNFTKFISPFTIQKPDIKQFKHYLQDVAKDITSRVHKKKGISEYFFTKYYELPGLIAQRLFVVFCGGKKMEYLSDIDFINNMTILFSGNFKKLVALIFKMFDFNNDGKIIYDDIRIILSYVPISHRKIDKKKFKFEQDEFIDRVKLQKEIAFSLQTIFKNNQTLDLNQFIDIVQNKTSDIFIFLLMFILERKPFTQEVIDAYKNLEWDDDDDDDDYDEDNDDDEEGEGDDCNENENDNDKDSDNDSDSKGKKKSKSKNFIKEKITYIIPPKLKSHKLRTPLNALKSLDLSPSSIPISEGLTEKEKISKIIINNKDSIKTNNNNNNNNKFEYSNSNDNIYIIKNNINRNNNNSENEIFNEKNEEIIHSSSDKNLPKIRKNSADNNTNNNEGNEELDDLVMDIDNDLNKNIRNFRNPQRNFVRKCTIDPKQTRLRRRTRSIIQSDISNRFFKLINLDNVKSLSEIEKLKDSKETKESNNSINEIKEEEIDMSSSSKSNSSGEGEDYDDNSDNEEEENEDKDRDEIKDKDKDKDEDDSNDSFDSDDDNSEDKVYKIKNKNNKRKFSSFNFNYTNKYKGVIKEGYLYKFSDSGNNKLKKSYFKIINKEFYSFKNKDSPKTLGMHCLLQVFIKEEYLQEVNDKEYYMFSLIIGKKTKDYYVEKKKEYLSWIECFKNILHCEKIEDLYEIHDKIGKGKFASVYRGTHKASGRKVAIKILEKHSLSPLESEMERNEIEISKICQHPNIIKLYDVMEDNEKLYIIMELCEGPDLFSYMELKQFKLSEQEVAIIIHKLCSAIFYLEAFGIIHRDIKPENIVLTNYSSDYEVKLIDLGLGIILGPEETSKQSIGTVSYAAPEVLQSLPYDKSIDIWGLGILSYILLVGVLPFDHPDDDNEVARQTINEPPLFDEEKWGGISFEAKEFVRKCLEKKPQDRLNIEQILQHEWFKHLISDELIQKRINKRKESNTFFDRFEIFTSSDINLVDKDKDK